VIDLLNWAIERPHWYEAPRPLTRAGRWGIATIQQRMLVRAELLAQTIAQYAYFEAIGDAIQRITTVLRTHWPASADEMPLYPAFRSDAT
ncbi:MAG TPA: hypothetical protein VFT99_05600, partial [Roseiflexaceae bacterium]|nr:hypothetical protein [Roseiflexaceae bacterium]